MKEKLLFDKILEDLKDHNELFLRFNKSNNLPHDFWLKYSENIFQELIANPSIISNFRKFNLTVTDVPVFSNNLKKIIFNIYKYSFFKKQHYQIADLEDAFDFIKTRVDLDILKRFPVPKTGKPAIYKKKDISYTLRWIRHHWMIQLYKNFLIKEDEDIQTVLDIGSNYGQFDLLFKKQFPSKTFIMLDFPEKLAVCHYYLIKEFPNSKIASFKDLKMQEIIKKDYIKNFDFILLPIPYLNKLDDDSVDLLTNFCSFNEMPIKWKDFYFNSKAMKTTKFFLTLNRIIKPQYDSRTKKWFGNEKNKSKGTNEESNEKSISIIDFRLNNFNKIHFDTCKLYRFQNNRKSIFFNKKSYHEPLFEFIGSRK